MANFSAPPQPHIKRPGAPVTWTGALETNDQRSQRCAFQPVRHLALENAALGERIVRPGALARDDQHNARATRLSAPQEMAKRRMRIRLRHAVQVDAVVDRFRAACELRPHAAA